MCSNYHPATPDKLRFHFGVAQPDADYKDESYPGYMAPIIRPPHADAVPGDRACALAMFGMVPYWADTKLARQTYNARTETVATKPSFRNAFKRAQFCIVPANSFFEPNYAPEKMQAFGEKSKQSLSAMCFGQDAYYDAHAIDKYRRTVAVVSCGGVEVNRAQAERGMAWGYTKYNNDLPLLAIESQAKQSRKGLWADKSPTPPWEFRHPAKKVSAGGSDSTCHIRPQGGRYRLVNGHKRYGC